jgi:hypothetical protein
VVVEPAGEARGAGNSWRSFGYGHSLPMHRGYECKILTSPAMD